MQTSARITGDVQHACWQTRSMPPVERLLDGAGSGFGSGSGRGLWSIPVPIPDSPLRYVSTYAFETGEGIVIVDPGWNADVALEGLVAGLETAGFRLADVRGVVITHLHPDHYGLADRVRDGSGAWVAMHRADIAASHGDEQWYESVVDDLASQLIEAGAPAEQLGHLDRFLAEMRGLMPERGADRALEDGERLDIPGWRVRAIWTPGHTPGHICLADEEHGLLLSGDHLLPTISSHIGLNPGDVDPLGDYLASLRRLAALPEPREVLPAHQWRFAGVGERVGELLRHHEERLAELLRLLAEGETTLWALTERLTWSKPFESFEPIMRRAAMSETHAHLRYLQRRGRVIGEGSNPRTYRMA